MEYTQRDIREIWNALHDRIRVHPFRDTDGDLIDDDLRDEYMGLIDLTKACSGMLYDM